MEKFNLDVFKDKNEFLNDIKQCFDYLNLLRSNSKNKSNVDQKFLSQREALQENVSKILIRSKEEWKLVLMFASDFVDLCLETLGHVSPFEPIFEMVMDFFRNLTVCINIKRIGRCWPTEVTWLTRLVDWLEEYLKICASYNTDNWSTVYTLVLWLASAIRTPFDLCRFDQKSENKSLISRIIYIIETTSRNYSLYPVVHLLCAGFYSRPDITNKIEDFISFILKDFLNLPVNDKLCSLRIVASLIKTVDRTVMNCHVDKIVETILPLVVLDSNHELITKLYIKILGRSSLTKIKPRLFKWRYNCGKRIATNSENGDMLKEIKSELVLKSETQLDENNDDEEFDQDLPEYFENLIQILIKNINHQSTVVRFSVSKYLASICSRLPYEFSEEILTYVCELCSPSQDDLSWHGACLTLAEFVRRGFVHIDFMPTVVNVVKKALFYEHIKGSFSLGTHVRDSAAYICWSMARAYDARLIGQFVDQLAPLLICAACFDRQLNCRRAASAVIQELAGRTQIFPHWIDVISRTEFHELSTIEHTYLNTGVHFAQYDTFQITMIDHLCDKCTHWDPVIRRLAALTLGKLSGFVPFANTNYLERLQKGVLFPDVNIRHGSILALAHILLNDSSVHHQTDLLQMVTQLVDQLNSKNLFSGIAGDFMREACLTLIENYCTIANSAGSMKSERLFPNEWEKFVEECILCNESNDLVQLHTVSCAVSMVHVFSTSNKIESFVDGLLRIVNQSGQRHFSVSTVAKIFKKISSDKILSNKASSIIDTFSQYLVNWFDQNEIRRSESIADSIRVLLSVCKEHFDKLDSVEQDKVFDLLLRCLNDHTITNKGDTGLCVRVASIESVLDYAQKLNKSQLFRVLQLISSEAAFQRKRSFLLSMHRICHLAKLILVPPTKNDQILSQLEEQHLYKLSLLQIQTSSNNGFNISEMDDSEVYQECVALLSCPSLTYDLFPGLVCVLSDPILDRYSKMITTYIRSATVETRQDILRCFLRFYTDKIQCNRLLIPCMVSAQTLLLCVTTDCAFQRSLAEITWSACKNSLNPKKYLMACNIFCALIPLDDQNIQWTFGYIFVLLGHRLPRVRSYTATEFYAVFQSLDENCVPLESIEQIGVILQETDWFNIKDARNAREQIRTMLKASD